MAPPPSGRRLNRSQAETGTPSMPDNSLATMTPSASVKTPGSLAFSKAGRRVLAELVCNDSPIVGLLPEGSPYSVKRNPEAENPPRSRRDLLENSPALECSSTPLGESLLRSQVQLLLQKVGSDVYAHMNKPPYIQSRNGCSVVSPINLAAPTPLNTPSLAPQPLEIQDASNCQNIVQFESLEDICSGSPKLSELNVLNASEAFPTMPKMVNVVSSASDCSAMAASNILDTNDSPRSTPFHSEGSDLPSSGEIFNGRRVLCFDGDSPEKSMPPQDIHDVTSTCHTSLVRVLEDDEVSEWSVHVNVGSPAPDKQDIVMNQVEVKCGEGPWPLKGAICPSISEHVQKMQEEHELSSKVHLLWDDDRVIRKKIPYMKEECPRYEEENVEEEGKRGEEFSEECYYYIGEEQEGDGEEGEYVEYEDLCDMFRGMSFVGEEKSKGLPRGEGKHIRFLYGNEEDEDVFEAMEVKREVDALNGGGCATRLNGVPPPRGRHLRFSSNDEEEQED